jgi:mannan endo-1,4-beta-mannosidase
MKYIALLCLFLLALSCQNTPVEDQEKPDTVEVEYKLAVANPSQEAQNLYNYLKQNFETNIITASMANVNWNTNEAQWVFQHTGKEPAINVFDYIHLYASPANWIDYGNTSVVEQWYNSGGIVGAMWHWNVPKAKGAQSYAFYSADTDFNVFAATYPETDEYDVAMRDLERLADCLLLLKEKNIPVLWRPLHEAAGKWFWWGAMGAEPCKRMWRMMFDYFQQRGLNNLIWIWTSEPNDDNWYPGDQYVDIIACDVYSKNTAWNLQRFNYLKLKYPTKPIAMSECGNVSDMQAQWDAGAHWGWFMPWYDYQRTLNPASADFQQTQHQYASIDWWTKVLNMPNVITKDKLPDLK